MIHTLQLYGPSTPTRLAAATGLSSGGVTVALDRLEKGGYIRREPNPADRRSLLIHINPARLLKLKGIYENVEAETRRCTLHPPQGRPRRRHPLLRSPLGRPHQPNPLKTLSSPQTSGNLRNRPRTSNMHEENSRHDFRPRSLQ